MSCVSPPIHVNENNTKVSVTAFTPCRGAGKGPTGNGAPHHDPSSPIPRRLTPRPASACALKRTKPSEMPTAAPITTGGGDTVG